MNFFDENSIAESEMQHEEEIESFLILLRDTGCLGHITVSDVKFLLDDFRETEERCS